MIIRYTLFAAAVVLLSFTSTDLEKKSLLNDKIEILLPKTFTLMGEDMLKIKYPSANRPKLVYTNPEGTVNIAFNHTPGRATQGDLETIRKSLVESLKKSHPLADWKATGVRKINGRNVGYLELITPAVDTKVYNLMFFTDVDDRLLISTFNCTIGEQDEWMQPAQEIVNSLKVK